MIRQSPEQMASPAEAAVDDGLSKRWPFQTRVDQVAAKRFEAELKDGATGVRDMEGIKPRLQLSMIYHNVRRAELWNEGCAARVAFVGRLMADGVPKKSANSLAWRLIEDALCGCEHENGFHTAILAAELEAMLAYGEERKYPAFPSMAEIADALQDTELLFPANAAATRLPTTVMQLCQRLGLWDAAQRVLEQLDPDSGKIGEHSTSGAWRMMGNVLATNRSVAEIRNALCIRVHDPRQMSKARRLHRSAARY